jgi:hypothetical protein
MFDPTPVIQEESENLEGNREYKWWYEEDLGAVQKVLRQKKEQASKIVEKDRYLKALRSLVADKGATTGNVDFFCEDMEVQM